MTALSVSAADRLTPQSSPFEIRVPPDRDVVYVEPSGELDIATAGRLCDQLDELVATGFAHVVIDLRELVFIAFTAPATPARHPRQTTRSPSHRHTGASAPATICDPQRP
jgi:hypothetical protein